MGLYQNNIVELSDRLRSSFEGVWDQNQIKAMSEVLEEFSASMQRVTDNGFINLFSEELRDFVDETKESEKLSQMEFEKKYLFEMNVCKQLGNAGWVISEHSNPRKIKEWYSFLRSGEPEKIETYFEGENEHVIIAIIQGLGKKYHQAPYKNYFSKAKLFWEQGDYMTSAMYLVALIDVRTNKVMKFPRGIKYSEKYSEKGFKNHLYSEFGKANSFFRKRFLFLDMYPSIIEFLKRLFVEGNYTFESGNEPPYINRN